VSKKLNPNLEPIAGNVQAAEMDTLRSLGGGKRERHEGLRGTLLLGPPPGCSEFLLFGRLSADSLLLS